MLKLPAAEVVKEPVRVTSVPPPTYPDKGRDAFARNCTGASALRFELATSFGLENINMVALPTLPLMLTEILPDMPTGKGHSTALDDINTAGSPPTLPTRQVNAAARTKPSPSTVTILRPVAINVEGSTEKVVMTPTAVT
jgi:hypothetical protein